MKLFYEKCCGSCGQAMHFTALFGHKNPYPNGEAEKTGSPRFKVAGFFFSAHLKQTGEKKPAG